MVFDRGTGSGCRKHRLRGVQIRRNADKTADREHQRMAAACSDLFVERYPVAAKVVPFEMFSEWVDEALENMKNMLKNNQAARRLVEGVAEGEKENG